MRVGHPDEAHPAPCASRPPYVSALCTPFDPPHPQLLPPTMRAAATAAAPLRAAARAAVATGRRSALAPQQVRNLSLHEYLSMGVLNKYGVPTPKFVSAATPAEARAAAEKFPNGAVIKAQVLAGGRGKGHFDSGLQGGVHLLKNGPAEAEQLAQQMLGAKLITKQTGADGRICNKVVLAEARAPHHEYYVALLNDRASQGPVLIASNQGGMSIEEVAKENPSAIITTPIDFKQGLTHEKALEIAHKLGFTGPEQEKEAAQIFVNLYKLFEEKDATQVEINPLAESKDGAVLCMDAKLGFDDHAEFRQQDIFAQRDLSQENPAEVEAAEVGLNYIQLDGNIACLVNGAGLAMATMDVLKLKGGDPANFLDVGGGANAKAVKKAFEIILRSDKVKAIFVNIFGGIMRCDVIADGIIQATKELQLSVPLVVRLQGTKEQEAKAMIKQSGLKIYSFDGLDEAAKAAVDAAGKGSL